MTNQFEECLFTMADVMKKLKLKRTAFFYLRKSGKFPEPICLSDSPKAKRWTQAQIDGYLKAIQ